MQSGFVPIDSVACTQVLSRLDHDFFHLPEYLRLSAAYEQGEARVFIAEEGSSALIVPLIVRPIDQVLLTDDEPIWDATSAYGYATPLLRGDNDFAIRSVTCLLDALRSRSIVSCFLRLHPLFEMPDAVLARAGKVICHGPTVSIDLTQPEETIWGQVRRSHRRNIRQAEAKGYVVVDDPSWAELNAFLDIYHSSMRQRNADRYYLFPRGYFETLRQRLAGQVHLVVVRRGAEIAAASTFTEWGGIVTAFLGGTAERFVGDGPMKLADAHVTTWAKRRGNRLFHLGGGVGADEDSLFQYKAGFSPRRHSYRTWQIITDQPRYDALSARWRCLNDRPESHEFFPAYRSRPGQSLALHNMVS